MDPAELGKKIKEARLAKKMIVLYNIKVEVLFVLPAASIRQKTIRHGK